MAEVQKSTAGSREDTMRFLDMVSLFSSQAMMALGKLANPMTGKAEKHLDAARLFIDTLEMLEHKTQGNLTPDESRLLKATLSDLRLMYVEEAKQPAPAPAAEPAATDAKPAPAPEVKPETDESKVKFHKSYGEG
jgi:hypothetical protein